MPEERKEPAYLGDGVYISHDGWHVWLAANHHLNRVIALEPNVLLLMAAWIRANDPETAKAMAAVLGGDETDEDA